MKMRQQQQPLNWYFNKNFVENKKPISAWIVRRISIEFFISQPRLEVWHESAFRNKKCETPSHSCVVPNRSSEKNIQHSHSLARLLTSTPRCTAEKCLRAINCFRVFSHKIQSTYQVMPSARCGINRVRKFSFFEKSFQTQKLIN